ncbi:hypothetical protein SISNIDRAFT_469699 [Sistotremastrum niveocremeum HHB9708]|uniref:Arrestin-like N-terminal domain-containing protein n=1 Tax=Sistotremastrum niveocremeum HHB9708 TaxID=1314777 RepID=A0A164PSH1_9AGAM|nr:hypothetical protein SISNIDRAFT_469699 [Sistotremastrum niveocremeum HHB9708]
MASHTDTLLSIHITPGLRTPGAVVEGNARLHIEKLREKEIMEVAGRLIGEALSPSADTVSENGYRLSDVFLKRDVVLWTPQTVTEVDVSGFATIPFTFEIPQDEKFPPSFECVGRRGVNGAVEYRVEVVGLVKKYDQKDVRASATFPFLPFDTTPAITLVNCSRQSWRKEKNIRKALLFSTGAHISAEISLPKVEALPIFQSIPIEVKITSFSDWLSQSASSSPDSHLPPLPQNAYDLDLKWICQMASKVGEPIIVPIAIIPGMKESPRTHYVSPPAWQSALEVQAPQWMLKDDLNPSKGGRWSREIIFRWSPTLTCPPSFETSLFTLQYRVELIVHLPGMRNDLQLQTGLLTLSSGVYPEQPEQAIISYRSSREQDDVRMVPNTNIDREYLEQLEALPVVVEFFSMMAACSCRKTHSVPERLRLAWPLRIALWKVV